MDYNWGDPKKNSLLSSRMMAKAEMTRRKRLTNVKSTLSNQLHPAIDHKLRKKKKAPGSARQNVNSQEDEKQSINPNNNDISEQPEHDSTKIVGVSRLAHDDDTGTLDTIRQNDFPLPARVSCTNKSMFDEFSLNAAADGLFHPASTIEAFTEHDAKYRQEIQQRSDKPCTGTRQARSGGEYPPSRENHKLPSLRGGKVRHDRVSSRPESKQHRASTRVSAPASISTTSSLSKLLDVEETKRSLSANQSDSNLYAPRRLDTVPSTGDRNALDFYESEEEGDNNRNNHSLVAESLIGPDNNEIPEHGSNVVPPLDISLTRKFEELKLIMKSNRAKHNSARQKIIPTNTKVPKNAPVSPKASHSRTSEPGKNSTAASSGSSARKGGEVSLTKAKVATKNHSTRVVNTKSGMSCASWNSKRQGNHASTRKLTSSVAVVSAPPIRSKKEVKVRSGVSLSDLKAEHREALQMLKELGGPVDPDYQCEDNEALTSSKGFRMGRIGSRTTAASSSSGSVNMLGDSGSACSKKLVCEMQALDSVLNPTSSGMSMVTKLRESVSSGRDPSRDTSLQTSSERQDDNSDVTVMTSCNSTPCTSNQTQSSSDIVVDHHENGVVSEAVDTEADTNSQLNTAHTASSASLLETISSTVDPWKQYVENDHEDNNDELEHEDSRHNTNTPSAAQSGECYSDEDFESDW